MADTERPKPKNKRDTAEYSAIQAPETKAEAEEPRLTDYSKTRRYDE